MAPRRCACGAQVVVAETGVRTLLLDYALAPKGAVAARIDPGTETWQARYLRFGELVDRAAEVRFRQHDVTCPSVPKLREDT